MFDTKRLILKDKFPWTKAVVYNGQSALRNLTSEITFKIFFKDRAQGSWRSLIMESKNYFKLPT